MTDPMTRIPSSDRIRSWFGAGAATSFAFSGLLFVLQEEDLGFGLLAFGLCFVTFALTFRWTPSVERLRRPPEK